MNGILEFFQKLFSADGFTPRKYCDGWQAQRELALVHNAADLTIFGAYVAIPLVLFYFVRHRKDLPFRHLFWLFGLFIISCGATHLLEFYTFSTPIYRFTAVIKVVTALASWGTVVALVPVAPIALAMRSPEQLEKIVDERTAELDETARSLRLANAQLQEEINERMRAQDAKRLSEEQLRMAIESAAIGVWNLDPKTHELACSESCLQLFGLNPNHLFSEGDLRDRIHPEDLPLVDAAHAQALETKRDISVEYRVKTEAGETRWLSSRGKYNFDEQGRPLALHGVVLDVTERRERERSAQLARLELERKVAERTAELSDANEELTSYSYSIAHDLRAPLRHIAWHVTLLRECLADTLSDEPAEHMGLIEASSSRMGQLIDDLLSFSRMSRLEINKKVVDSDALVKDICGELSADLDGRSVVWEVGSMPEVRADPSLIRQVWLNLLQNAVKFTAAKPEARIVVGAIEEPGFVKFFVRDNGIGFEMKYVDKLFGVFERLHTNQEAEGTGIGLAIVARIVQRHGGRVSAEGVVGEGATFTFSIPTELETTVLHA